ncbi:MAG: hypothetical protein NTV51_16910 [Verrucomicrobia bacterium]|nr:hypothetical protein [Verrucomicrobiota bacterium]
MQLVLARHAAFEAARAKTAAIAALHATATAFGAKDAHHGFNGFLAQMDAVIAASVPTPEISRTQPSREELATFAHIAARARPSS